MRRIRRILINGLTILSLLLCVATCVMWVRSYFSADYADDIYGESSGSILIRIVSNRGVITILRARMPRSGETGLFWKSSVPSDYGRRPLFKGYDFGQEWLLYFPHWFVLLPCAVLPTTQFFVYVRKRRRCLTGHCPACGYDLRATPDRCPECGAVPKTATSLGTL